MKYIYSIVSLLLFLSCKSQTPTLPLYENSNYGSVEGAYYKDVDDFLNQFEGTWVYTDSSTYLKLVFVKKPMLYNNTSVGFNYYEDFLIGGSQYIVNGVELNNTLSSVLTNNNPYDYYIFSMNRISKNTFPKCVECTENEKRLSMSFDEINTKADKCLEAEFVIRRIFENGVEKLKIQFIKTSSSCGDTLDGPLVTDLNYSLPYGEYTLVKLD